MKTLFDELKEEHYKEKKQEKEKFKEILKSSEMYRPSNGTEGMWFEDNICATCKKFQNFCKTLIKLYKGKTKEIRRDTDSKEIFCTRHTKFWTKTREEIIYKRMLEYEKHGNKVLVPKDVALAEFKKD